MYYDELDAILGNRAVCNPPIVLDTGTGLQDSNILDGTCTCTISIIGLCVLMKADHVYHLLQVKEMRMIVFHQFHLLLRVIVS